MYPDFKLTFEIHKLLHGHVAKKITLIGSTFTSSKTKWKYAKEFQTVFDTLKQLI